MYYLLILYYGHFNRLKTIKFTPSFLFSDNKNNEYTEADFVNKLWAPLFESFFRDSPNVTLKW